MICGKQVCCLCAALQSQASRPAVAMRKPNPVSLSFANPSKAANSLALNLDLPFMLSVLSLIQAV